MKLNELLSEKWSDKYKRSINCSNPKGFSQKAHCAGRKKHESVDEAEVGSLDYYKDAWKKGRDLNFTGKDTPSKEPAARKSNTVGRVDIRVDRYQLNDLKYVMQAVLKGDVQSLSSAQIESARELLKQLNNN